MFGRDSGPRTRIQGGNFHAFTPIVRRCAAPTPTGRGRATATLARAAFAMAALVWAGGCSPSDKSTMQQASQFNSGLKPAEVPDAPVNDYLQQIGKRIIASAKEADRRHVGPKTHFDKKQDESWMFSDRIQFHLVNSSTLNAFTTGGEHVYIYNELLQQCKNEDELAAVMAHEFGHIYCRHVQKGMKRQTAAMLGAGVLGAAGYAAGGSEHGAEYAQSGAGLAAAAGQFINMGFTRGDEAQADELGFWFYTHAGWDPQQFGNFFKTMIAKGYDTTSAVSSDHPTLKSRVEAADARVKALPESASAWRKPETRTQAEFEQFKQEAQNAAKRIPDDKSVAKSQQLLQALPRSCWVPNPPQDQIDAQRALEEQAKPTQSDPSK